jgi:hypothetical protein
MYPISFFCLLFLDLCFVNVICQNSHGNHSAPATVIDHRKRCRDKYTPVEVRRDFTELRAGEITGWLGAAPDPNRTVQRNARPPREWGFNLCVIFPGRIMQGPRDPGTAVKQTGWHSLISQGSHGAPTPWGLNRVETGQHHKASLGPALPRGHTA